MSNELMLPINSLLLMVALPEVCVAFPESSAKVFLHKRQRCAAPLSSSEGRKENFRLLALKFGRKRDEILKQHSKCVPQLVMVLQRALN